MADGSRWLEVESPRVFIDTMSDRLVVVDRTGAVMGAVPSGLGEVCIGCGCSSIDPCDDCGDGCCWLAWDEVGSHAVCTECDDHRARFDAGDRTFGPALAVPEQPSAAMKPDRMQES